MYDASERVIVTGENVCGQGQYSITVPIVTPSAVTPTMSATAALTSITTPTATMSPGLMYD